MGDLIHDTQNSLPSDLHKQVVDDLFEEAEHWLDGSAIETEAQAEGVEKLLALIRAEKEATEADKTAEKKPHDDAGKAVLERYKPLLARADLIITGCRTLLTPWRNKQAEAKRVAAAEIAAAAEELARKAQEATAAAGSDLGALGIAKTAEEDARRLGKRAKTVARQADKGSGLRTYKIIGIDDLKVAIGHYYRTRQDEMQAFIQGLAEDDARHGINNIPGVTITEKKGAI